MVSCHSIYNKIIPGKELSQEILSEVSKKIKYYTKCHRQPCLAVILIGDNKASAIYVSHKINACMDVGITSLQYNLDKHVDINDVLQIIDKLNNDNSVDGILVQLPLPEHLDKHKILNSIDCKKDVDGLGIYNFGALLSDVPKIVPCTPTAVLYILDSLNVQYAGARIVVIGASNLVGKPLAVALINRLATVTICNHTTVDLKYIAVQADIVIVAIGQAQFINKNYIKPGAIVIDIGINVTSKGTIVGDVNFDDVIDVVSYITPVPGGVGQLTVAMLMKNTLLCCENNIYNK